MQSFINIDIGVFHFCKAIGINRKFKKVYRKYFSLPTPLDNSRVNSNFKKVNPYKVSGLREGIFSEFILGCSDTV